MDPDAKSSKMPRANPFRKLLIGYLKGVDALIGVLAAALTATILGSGIWYLARLGAEYLFSPQVSEICAWVVVVICLPPLIRLGLWAGGFKIKAILSERAARPRDPEMTGKPASRSDKPRDITPTKPAPDPAPEPAAPDDNTPDDTNPGAPKHSR